MQLVELYRLAETEPNGHSVQQLVQLISHQLLAQSTGQYLPVLQKGKHQINFVGANDWV